eukprot:TRINITY_DN80810_c0_g1_i1.p1 TRINITY_DN80810_c0_g1~~TRINITY_DN80810_c0_g1_i1.p1  ORF type:complete len:253 (+),score=60.78 TRINITY_DN80810_c0_g1_i1:83-760(+)
MAARVQQHRSSRAKRGVALLIVAAWGAPTILGFVGLAPPTSRLSSSVALRAEAEKQSVALVKVTEENTVTTAGVLGGLAGLALGGVWVGGALFAATSYLARKKDDDVAKGLQGVASGSLEALNFVDYLANKYEVTNKVGSAINDALKSGSAGTEKTALDQVTEAIDSFDKEVGLKDTLGSILVSASDLGGQFIDKVVEVEKEYKIIDGLKEKISEAQSSTTSTTK